MADAMTRVMDALAARGCRVRRLGPDKARAQCPNHRDIRPSLAIDRKGGNVLLKDFGGCRVPTILDALGLKFPDLRDGPMPERSTTPQNRVAVYEYADLTGEAKARKVRLGPEKGFLWERQVTRGVWKPGLRGFKPQLFRWDEMVDAKRIVLTEGEKAVNLLRDLGYVAGCPPVGANTWVDAWTEALWRVGAMEIVILADADGPGRQHAMAVAESCYAWRPTLPEVVDDDPWPDVRLGPDDPEAAPLSARVVHLAGLERGEDVVDWLTVHRHTRADLDAAIDATAPWAPVDVVARKRELNKLRQQRFRARQRMGRNA